MTAPAPAKYPGSGRLRLRNPARITSSQHRNIIHIYITVLILLISGSRRLFEPKKGTHLCFTVLFTLHFFARYVAYKTVLYFLRQREKMLLKNQNNFNRYFSRTFLSDREKNLNDFLLIILAMILSVVFSNSCSFIKIEANINILYSFYLCL